MFTLQENPTMADTIPGQKDKAQDTNDTAADTTDNVVSESITNF